MGTETMEELKQSPRLLQEYEDSFTNEEKVSNALNIDKGCFSLGYATINLSDLSFTMPIKNSRKETYLGLTKSVEELGILTPIHVMLTEGYADWLDSGSEEEFEGFKYTVIDGFRRIYAGLKNNIKTCRAVIWEFEDKDMGSQLLTVLSRLLNKAQLHSWGEIWYLLGILELQTSMSPGTLEYLLSLEPGDAMKLKDIMMSDYPEVKDELLGNKKNLTQCYNMLQKLRKEEDQLLREDTKGISEVDEASDMVEEAKEDNGSLSDEEVRNILEMGDNFDGELSEDDFDEMVGNDVPDEVFDVHGDRHLDPALRAAVLQRDNYTCQVSGVGVDSGLPTEVALAILQVHHKVPVADGGPNTLDNLITIAQDPHTLVHVIQRRMGKLGMPKEKFDELDVEQQEYIKKVMKLARIAIEADKRCGRTRDDIKKDTKNQYKMPGVIQKENIEAIKQAKKQRE